MTTWAQAYGDAKTPTPEHSHIFAAQCVRCRGRFAIDMTPYEGDPAALHTGSLTLADMMAHHHANYPHAA